jgi:alginate O-acetyltransferase complex protein AlgI
MGGWVLFRCETWPQALGYYAALLGAGAPAGPAVADYVDPLVVTTLAVAVVGATQVARRLGAWRDRIAASGGARGSAVQAVDVAWLGAVFVAAAAWLAAGTYNPFIYFRF